MLQQILKLSGGNPGALTCLMGIIDGNIMNTVAGLIIIPKIEECNIKGTDLYVLWSDLCGKNYQVMASLCEKCPNEILIDACSRQDYSGRILVQPYMN